VCARITPILQGKILPSVWIEACIASWDWARQSVVSQRTCQYCFL
jgi:hypothetical protein